MKYLEYEELYNEDDTGGAGPEEQEQEQPENPPQNDNKSTPIDTAVNAAQKVQKAQKAAKNAKRLWDAIKLGSASGPLMVVLFWVIVIIIVLIIVIGILMFLLTMPGMAMENLTKMFKDVGRAIASFHGADTTRYVDTIEIYNVLGYLDKMGYDLKGEGFLTRYYTEDEYEDMGDWNLFGDGLDDFSGAESEAGTRFDKLNGVVRNANDEIIRAESDFINTYIVSDNYIYTIKNENLTTNLTEGNAGWWEKIGKFLSTVELSCYNYLNTVFGPVYDTLYGLTDSAVDKWGRGLLAFYYEDNNNLGQEGNFVNLGTIWDWSNITVDIDRNKLIIEKDSLFNNNKPMEYNLDGWTGRYGMPLEFLLSVHKATLMPDLAYDMATTFNTNVNIYLHDLTGDVDAAYKNNSGDMISHDELRIAIDDTDGDLTNNPGIEEIFGAVFGWFDGLITSEQEIRIMLAMGVDHHELCECDEKEVVEHRLKENLDILVYKSDNATPDDGSDDYYYYMGVDETGTSVEIIVTEDEIQTTSSMEFVEVCEACKKYVRKVINEVKAFNDNNYRSLQPYIASVTNHWYRDVYFIETDKDFVTYDHEYEALTKERWTLYQTYTSNSSDGDLYKPEWEGEFVLYEIDESGDYKRDEYNNLIRYDGTQQDYEDAQEAARELAKTDPEAANEILNTKVAKKAVTANMTNSEGQSLIEDLGWNETGDMWTAYKVEEGSTESGYQRLYTDEQLQEYAEGSVEREVKERLYINIVTNGNVIQTGEGIRLETNRDIKKMFLQNNYFAYTGNGEDAEIITELRNKIYEKRKSEAGATGYTKKYGAISDDEIVDGDGNYISYELERETVDENGEPITEMKEYFVKDYIGQVGDVLNQTALNAFTMLENTHTLDADYIYRDFKELIVELGYFEKEELTETPPRLLQFLVPEIGSAGYPETTIDKRENEISSTMIHSKGDIDANNKYKLTYIMDIIGSEVSQEFIDSAGGTSNPSSKFNDEDATVDLTNPYGEDGPEVHTLSSNPSRLNMLSVNTNINISEVGAMSGTRTNPSQISLNDFIETTRKMCEEINIAGYDYCANGPEESCETCLSGVDCGMAHCHHEVWGNSCFLPRTFEDSISETSKHNFCCATLVSWALQNVGVMLDEEHTDSADGVYQFCLNKLDYKWIDAGEPMKEGDILFYGSETDKNHVDLVGKKLSDGYEKYNGGHYVLTGAVDYGEKSAIEKITSWPSGCIGAIRLNWGNSEGAEYEGYLGNEAVVSPVTGILIDYGTYTDEDINVEHGKGERINVDLKYGPSTKLSAGDGTPTSSEVGVAEDGTVTLPEYDESRLVSDKVGYARIFVIDPKSYEKLESLTGNSWKTLNSNQGLYTQNGRFKDVNMTEEEFEELREKTEDSNSNVANKAILDETIYGYKEFAELYEKYGISGYMIYIDGFKCELPDKDFVDSNEDGSLDDEGLPDGVDLTLDSFKVYANQLANVANDENSKIQTQYEMPLDYKIASKDASSKLAIEEAMKADASPALTLKQTSGDDIIFIKEGTIIGRTFTDREVVETLREDELFTDYRPEDSEEEEIVNEDKLVGNYIRISMRSKSSENNKDGSDIENIEEYLKLDELSRSIGDQPYVAQEGDDVLLANMMHLEGCIHYFGSMTSEEEALGLNMATGYVLLNRALVNYGNHGETLYEQLHAPGQYETATAIEEAGDNILCIDCYENAQLCLQYDCDYLMNLDGIPMTRDVLGQSGQCQCSGR